MALNKGTQIQLALQTMPTSPQTAPGSFRNPERKNQNRVLLGGPLAVVRDVPFRFERSQRGHANTRIPERAIRILLDLWWIQAAKTRAVRPRVLTPHDVRERFGKVGVLFGLLIEPGQNPVAAERHPDVVVRIGVALV